VPVGPAAPTRSLGEAAYAQLRADIVSCRLVPGQMLTERRLAAVTEFGISPLREALTRLDSDGLVRTLPRKGYQVTPLTPKRVDDLFVVWTIVGPEIARLGVQNASADQRRRASEALVAVTGIHRLPFRADRVVAADEAAHRLFSVLAEASGNAYLIAMFTRLARDIARVWSFIALAEQSWGPDDETTTEDLTAGPAPSEAAARTRAYIVAVHARALDALSRMPAAGDAGGPTR
jgi:DNA-binding GntR family transcriptional regulator